MPFEKIKNMNFCSIYISKDFKTKFDTLKIIEDKILKTTIKNNIVYFFYPFDVLVVLDRFLHSAGIIVLALR